MEIGENKNKIILKCDFCGKEFQKYKSDAKSKKHFCSTECLKKYRETLKVRRNCKQCGKDFEVLKSALEKSNSSGNFCCRSCYNEFLKTQTGILNKSYNRIETECPTCGKKVLVTHSKKKKYKNNFCSLKCRSAYMVNYVGGEKNCNWRGGCSRKRGNFDAVKKQYFSKRQFCAICGTTENIHIHHIIPYRLTQDNGVDNLIPLCARHHKIVESASLDFIEGFDDGRYEIAKKYMNIMLRGYQAVTIERIKKTKERLQKSGS